jgi:hypothetical protein
VTVARTLDAWDHWAETNGHVQIDSMGVLTRWTDHPGCHYCDVLSGRYAERAKRLTTPAITEGGGDRD